MLQKFLKFFNRDYKTLNQIEVSKEALAQNYSYLSSLNDNLKIAPVVKSNGYGHGIVNVAKVLQAQKPPFFCVDSLFEAYELLKGDINTPILIMGYTNPENLKFKKLPFSYAVYDSDFLKVINEYQPQAKVHIFVDTGMHREGVAIDQLPQFLNQLEQLPNIKVEGLISHLASSESNKDPLFQNQIKQFKTAIQVLKKFHIKPMWFHIAATGSIINPQTRPIIASVSNLARAGLALYGFSSTTFDKNLKPALKLTTKIAQIKKIKKGEKLGYDGTFIAKKDTAIGILPIGYQDGVDRKLSNKGIVTINNTECPILGRVSMNITTIDLSKIKNPGVGQKVIIYSNHPSDKNSLEYAAKLCKTISYELLIHLNPTIRRIIV